MTICAEISALDFGAESAPKSTPVHRFGAPNA